MTASISKRQHQENPNSFERLFQLGLSHIQQLSGNIWTDYNTHDPGITILEQVCYALTDIIYRCDFEVADYLADDHGRIDYTAKGLMPASKIFNPPPQQLADFEAYISRSIADLEQVWVQPLAQMPTAGLYQISALCERQQALGQTRTVINAIEQAYHASRGLGEDLESAQLIGDTWVHLHASIHIADDVHDRNRLAASIYEHARRWIQRSTEGNRIVALKESLLTLSGILDIDYLYFERDVSFRQDSSEDTDARIEHSLPRHSSLILPESSSKLKLSLIQQNHAVILDAADINLQLGQQRNDSVTTFNEDALSLPEGKGIDFGQYQSIQTLFPRNYHLAAGNPVRYQPQQQAEQHQLRSYLLLFDQLMTNFCQDLNGLKELFSTSLKTPQSYQISVLKEQQFTGIDQHYPADPQQKLQQLQAQFDHYPDRKGRLLDYLIALYGERYPDQIHRQINPYYSAEQLNWQILRYKQQFIRNIATLTNDRGLGDNLYHARHIGGYTQRIAALLGIQTAKAQSRTYSAGVTQHLLNLVPNPEYVRKSSGQRLVFRVSDSTQSHIKAVPARSQQNQRVNQQQSHLLRSIVTAFRDQIIPQSMLQHGMDNQRYGILQRRNKGEYQLFFHLEGQHWLYLYRHSNRNKVIRLCHLLQQWLVQLNRDSEGLYVIEHILLRTRNTEVNDLAHRVSLLLPGYTARFHNPQFRKMAAALIRQNTPAHLLLHIHWLDFRTFCEYEAHYLAWRRQKAKVMATPSNAAQQACDQLAERLHRCLQEPTIKGETLLL